ncbi:hypothetical protein BW900_28335 [Bacillus mycoides]|uniref:Uncharacterized protein n=1 Tax=Bacillus mycoides TaxID=1405 RepID=A0A1S9T0L9_BACMY|nr:hypothetical protein BW900_28335 [Bacillus mycoides]
MIQLGLCVFFLYYSIHHFIHSYPGMGFKVFICYWISRKTVLVQKLKDNCNESINLGHTVTITLERMRD